MLRESLMKKILDCIENPDYRYLTTEIYPDGGICFRVCEKQFPINVNVKTREVYIDTEGTRFHLDSNYLGEITLIMKVIEANLDSIEEWISGLVY